MACIAVPAVEAVIVTVAAHLMKNKEKNIKIQGLSKVRLLSSDKLMWLSKLLWGGIFLLTLEHIWHGEIVPFYPFLTAMNNPKDAAMMLKEMLSVGVTMSLVITSVWAGIVLITNAMTKNVKKAGTIGEVKDLALKGDL